MKKSFIASYIHGISDTAGERYGSIVRYFIPEVITAFFLYSLLQLIDVYFIGHLRSTSTYATQSATTTLLHFILKVAEGVSVGALVLCGNFNGAKDYKKVGQALVETLWVTVFAGAAIASVLYFGAYHIYSLLRVEDRIIELGLPFLKIRAIGVFFTFVYFGCVAFLRGIKDSKTPMRIFMLGGLAFVFFDYVLIFGKYGFPEMGLRGSALAGVIQYGVMMLAAFSFIFYRKDLREKYGIALFKPLTDKHMVARLIQLSWPVMLDKATMAVSYIWLTAMIAPMGKIVLASFSAIKDLERVGFLPAVAFAQVITFLVSNDFGSGNIEAVKSNIKKVLLLAIIFVLTIMGIFASSPSYFLHFFDRKGAFSDFSASVFPVFAVLIIFDVFQIVLSGALRGAADVRAVMWVRAVVTFGFFFPASYIVSHFITFSSLKVKFVSIYGLFYCGNALMSSAYIYRFRKDLWQKKLQ